MKNKIIFLLLIILNSCNEQNDNKTEEAIKVTEKINRNNLNETGDDGIIYFSTDDGMTWKNRSDGLPGTVSLGLGSIAVSSKSLAIATKEKGIYIFDFNKNIWANIPTDEKVIKSNPGSVIFYKDKIYVGTQYAGVFLLNNQGGHWTTHNKGLENLTIRKFAEIDHKLYVGTNGGLYSFNDILNKWELEYGPTLQVNGISEFGESLFIGTNQGAFKTSKDRKDWKQVLPGRSLHNISSDDKTIYAMVYNELLASADKGESWQSIQKGLPAGLYTFNVIKIGKAVFAGQWDGVYKKEPGAKDWDHSSNGLPAQFAVTNMQLYNGIIIVSTSERNLNEGKTINQWAAPNHYL